MHGAAKGSQVMSQEAPHQVQVEVGGRTLTLETGKMAKQANGAVLAKYGDTQVLVTACMETKHNDRDFLPLTVDYRENTYSAGKIPGGFFKREGRPSEREILTSRLIDRPLRPLFPEAWRNETQIVAMVLSADSENDPDVIAVTAASAAAFISDLPFEKPIAAVRVGLLDGRLVANPTVARAEEEPAQYRHRGQRGSHRDGGGGRARSLRGHRCRGAELRSRASASRIIAAIRELHAPAEAEKSGGAAAAVRRGAGAQTSSRNLASGCMTRSTPPSIPRRKAITWWTR